MIQSPQFLKNPSLYAFLPVFYMVWADAVLTPSEIMSIRKLIDEQKWLSKEEQDFLMSHIDPKNPPSPNQLKRWQNEIQNTAKYIDSDLKITLAEIGIQMVKAHQNDVSEDKLEQTKLHLIDLEQALGIVSNESAFHFHTAKHKTDANKEEGRKTFDVKKMQALLDGSNKDINDKVKTILSDQEFNYLDTDNLKEYREQVLKWCQHLADQGFGSMAYPKEYGGEGDMDKYFAIMETLSYHDLSTVIKFGVQFGLWGMSVYFLGTKKHHDKYLAAIGTLEIPGCFAMTETGHGSNVKGIETTATYNHKKQVFNINTPHIGAGKEYIGNAAVHGRMATVFAKLIIDEVDYGVNAFVVPLRNEKGQLWPGVRIEDCGRKMGLNGVDNGKIWFDNVEIGKDEMLDRYASVDENGEFQSPISSDNRRFFTMLGTLVGGRIGIPRSGLSAAKSGLSICIKYSHSRKQFGPENGEEVPILNYKTHQRRLMPLLANAYASHFALQYLTSRFLTRKEEDMQEIEALAAGLKAWCTWNTTSTLQECREALGGKGYLSENRIDRLKNDTDIYTTFEGDNTVLMQLVAKSRLSEFKKEFSDINFFGMLSYLAVQAKTNLSEKNPIVVRNTDPQHLKDFGFLLDAFMYRERSVVTSAARRFKNHLDQGMDSFDAFNQTQYHMLKVGYAFIERVILEQFIEEIQKNKDAQIQSALTRLCQLFALSQIEKNKGWYLENGYMNGAKTKAIRQIVNSLCYEVRQEAVPLVEAFGIPDKCLSAPIALNK
ncbi:acyl-CoA dehydrogenase family protein [Hyphobacterium sp. CCMP332]|nr:acyl-CoA dehydrogenase family protein [Hyphobacterium sp. CCMP332]